MALRKAQTALFDVCAAPELPSPERACVARGSTRPIWRIWQNGVDGSPFLQIAAPAAARQL